MHSDEHKTLLERYHQELASSADPARQVGWRSRATQHLRFAVCAEACDLTTIKSVLDVGCGLGDFAPFLRARGFTGQYLGVDVLPEMLESARKRHPAEAFRDGDIRALSAHLERFDLTVVCGSFNMVAGRKLDRFREQLDAVWSLTAHTLALVVVDRRWPRAALDPDLVSFDLSQLGALCRRLSPTVSLRCDFLPSDLAAIIQRGGSPSVRRLFENNGLDGTEAAELSLEMSLPEAALSYLSSVEVPERGSAYWLRHGQAMRALGDEVQATESLREALRIDPGNTEASLEWASLGHAEQ